MNNNRGNLKSVSSIFIDRKSNEIGAHVQGPRRILTEARAGFAIRCCGSFASQQLTLAQLAWNCVGTAYCLWTSKWADEAGRSLGAAG